MPSIDSLFSLKDQVALVTGAGAGIGKAISLMFAEAGADVACTDLNESDAKTVADQCRQFGGRSVGLGLDVTDEEQRKSVLVSVADSFGKLTILVNNAGGGGPKPFDMPLEDFDWAFQLNVYSLFRLCQLAQPYMKDAGGGGDREH